MTDVRLALNDFFIEVQLKAFRQAQLATGCRDEALDIVQDAMIRLAQKYASQRENWPQLFQRILQNLIRDWYRRKKVRSMLSWFHEGDEEKPVDDKSGEEFILTHPGANPEKTLQQAELNAKVMKAIQQLPQRQQHAFILRAWWEYGTRESAELMNCSEGSVKTHYSRAIARLGELLQDHEF